MDMLFRRGRWGISAVLSIALMLAAANSLAAQKIKIIVDQDARGPATTDMQSILVFLQSDKFDVLGITTVSGDQWVKEETLHTLRLVEIAGRVDVPVVQGAEYPLLNSKEESERWEALYGKFRYKGCWSDFSNRPASVPPAFRERYHPPDVVPPPAEGMPHAQALPETAAHFIVRMVHQYPGQVVLWAGGPLTNIALALRLDPEVAMLAKELVLMGSGMYADTGGINTVDGRREFNGWFDPEAARIVLRAPWKKITITPIDISIKTRLTPEIQAAIAQAHTPVAEYLTKYSVTSYMWDELSAAALVDPPMITATKQLYVDIDVSHGPSYGETLFWERTAQVPPYERLATVQFDLDTRKFYNLYIKLMTEPPHNPSAAPSNPAKGAGHGPSARPVARGGGVLERSAGAITAGGPMCRSASPSGSSPCRNAYFASNSGFNFGIRVQRNSTMHTSNPPSKTPVVPQSPPVNGAFQR